MSRNNYLLRHWRGELPLAVAYWLNGTLLVGGLSALMVSALDRLDQSEFPLRTLSCIGLAAALFSFCAWIWSVVGIWRSARHHVARGGWIIWAHAARAMVLIGLIAMLHNLCTSTLPQMRELGLIALGRDPIGQVEITVVANGHALLINGTLREGSAAKIIHALDDAPRVGLLVLNSNGGRVLEAEQLAQVVRARRLTTYVANLCASACTYVFLAGETRVAGPGARIGFHQPSFVGLDNATQQLATEQMQEVYRSAGLPEDFIQQVSQTPSDRIWFPTLQQLLAAHVVTRVARG